MAEHDEDVIAPPPPVRGRGLQAGPVEYRQPLEIPPNDAKQLVRQGFYLGLGIAGAFMLLSAVAWLLVMILVASAFAA